MYWFEIILFIAPSVIVSAQRVTYNVITWAGTGTNGAGNVDRTSATFRNPASMVFDNNRDLLITEYNNQRIRKISVATGQVSTYACSGTKDSVDGYSSSAHCAQPLGMYYHTNGDVYFAQVSNIPRVRKVTAEGNITTLKEASTDSETFAPSPMDMVMTNNGSTLIIADWMNTIYRYSSTGVVTTWVGNPTYGSTDGQGTNARIGRLSSMVIDRNNTLFITDYIYHKILRVNSTGYVTTFAGNGVGKSFDGVGTAAGFYNARGINFDRFGNLWVADSSSHLIRMVTLAGRVITIAGNSNLTTPATIDDEGTKAAFNVPFDVLPDDNGDVYVAEYTGNRIRKIIVCNETQSFNRTLLRCQNSGCPLGSQISVASASCVPCPAGTFKSTADMALCTTCPNGFEPNLNATACVPCSNGRYRPLNQTVCISCPENANCSSTSFTCLPGSQFDSSTGLCSQCPLGWFKSEFGNGVCSQCAVGTESFPSRSGCVTCSSGKYRPSLAQSVCINCPDYSNCSTTAFTCMPGSQLDGSGTQCSPCPIGSFKSSFGNGNCTQCPIGLQPSLNSTICSVCTNGTFKPSMDFKVCVDCPEGAICSPTNLTCTAGYTTSKQDAFTCEYCQKGFYKAWIGNDDCLACPNGLFSSDNSQVCLKCPAGSISVNPNSTECSRCGAGKQTDLARTYCMDCPSGTYKPTDVHDICLKCPIGATCTPLTFTCNAGYGMRPDEMGCLRCLDGYYKSDSGKKECNRCDIGQQSSNDRTKCVDCPQGSYRPSLDISHCIPCPPFATCSKSSFTCETGYKRNQYGSGCDSAIRVIGDRTMVEDENTQTSPSLLSTGSGKQNQSANLGILTLGAVLTIVIPSAVVFGILISAAIVGFKYYRRDKERFHGYTDTKHRKSFQGRRDFSAYHDDTEGITEVSINENPSIGYAQDIDINNITSTQTNGYS